MHLSSPASVAPVAWGGGGIGKLPAGALTGCERAALQHWHCCASSQCCRAMAASPPAASAPAPLAAPLAAPLLRPVARCCSSCVAISTWGKGGTGGCSPSFSGNPGTRSTRTNRDYQDDATGLVSSGLPLEFFSALDAAALHAQPSQTFKTCALWRGGGGGGGLPSCTSVWWRGKGGQESGLSPPSRARAGESPPGSVRRDCAGIQPQETVWDRSRASNRGLPSSHVRGGFRFLQYTRSSLASFCIFSFFFFFKGVQTPLYLGGT